MRYLKTYKESREFDDTDTLARLELFGANTKMVFSFGDQNIYPEDNGDIGLNLMIKDLIEKYNTTYIKNNEWGGGPVNKEFIEFMSNFLFDEDNNIGFIGKIDKPSISLIISTYNYGDIKLGYWINTKKCKSLSWNGIESTRARLRDINNTRPRAIWGYIKSEIVDERLTIDETIDLLDLNVENKIDWEWKDKL